VVVRVALGALLLAACASNQPRAPRSPRSAAVAISVRTMRSAEATWGRPRRIHFARLEGNTHALRAPALLESNHVRGVLVFLLDAEPGRYVAVAATLREEGRDVTVYFPQEMIRATEVEVGPGALGFMGSHELEQTTFRGGDDAQDHYAALLEPDWDRASLATRLFTRSRYRFGRRWRRLDGTGLRAEAVEHLASGGWAVR